MRKHILPLAALSLITAFGSCKKDKDNATPTYTIPTTYNFTNVNYSDQTKLMAMADQIVAMVNTANTSGTPVSAQKLKDMFNNTGGYFNDSTLSLNASGLKLSAYCSAEQGADMNNYFDSVGLYSQSTAVASQGTAGVVVSSANAKKYLLSPNGVFYSQVIKKTIMGIFAYQIANVHMIDGTSLDNNTVVAGSGTAMEHSWDQAFGFFGVPVTFPTTTTGSKYYGAYSNQVDPGMGSNATLMNAFLKGRAAISNKDITTKQAQAILLIKTFETLNAACIVQEMKELDAAIDANDIAACYSVMSETIGFVRTLKDYSSSTRNITSAQIAELESLIDSANPQSPNLYNFISPSMTIAQMKAKSDAIRQKIGTIYGFSATQLSQL